MSNFVSASQNAYEEIEKRRNARKGLLSLGIQFLDDTLVGVAPHDLVLLGAPSGAGKTQLCTQIAMANLQAGKKVHYFALEAERHEIERRMKFQLIASQFYASEDRRGVKNFSFDRWMMGDFIDALWDYEQTAAKIVSEGFKDLFIFYKTSRFGVAEMTEEILFNSVETDLILIDHVHYFDYDDENENRAVKEIAKTARTLSLEEGKPIILVSHLRKRDRGNPDLVAGLDEFHGSSDLYKIATKVITMAGGGQTDNGCYETFMRIPKNRMNGGVTRYIGRLLFNPKMGNQYEKEYKVGWASSSREEGFIEIDRDLYPDWATGAEKKSTPSSYHRVDVKRKSRVDIDG